MLVFVIWLLFWQFPCLIYEVDAFPMVSVANDNWNNVFDKEIYINNDGNCMKRVAKTLRQKYIRKYLTKKVK